MPELRSLFSRQRDLALTISFFKLYCFSSCFILFLFLFRFLFFSSFFFFRFILSSLKLLLSILNERSKFQFHSLFSFQFAPHVDNDPSSKNLNTFVFLENYRCPLTSLISLFKMVIVRSIYMS